MNLFADVVPESRANLNRDAFAAGTSAKQMSEPGAYCNHRDHAQWNFAFFAKGDPENHVHAAFGAFAKFFVTKNNCNTNQGEPRNPVKWVGVAHRAHSQEYLTKESRKCPHNCA